MTFEEFESVWMDEGLNSIEFLNDEALDRSKMLNPLRDIHAYILLQSLMPDMKRGDMVVSAEHDQIWLSPDCSDLADVITRDQIIELMRCGVSYDEDTQSLFMYV